ncbi:MAG: hypothetical protein DRJ03_27700 [Chloroflexi bacterium]|nr:MAG: hypothetical protein DRJ03_27700 [Chloroflexota bacterium]
MQIEPRMIELKATTLFDVSEYMIQKSSEFDHGGQLDGLLWIDFAPLAAGTWGTNPTFIVQASDMASGDYWLEVARRSVTVNPTVFTVGAAGAALAATTIPVKEDADALVPGEILYALLASGHRLADRHWYTVNYGTKDDDVIYLVDGIRQALVEDDTLIRGAQQFAVPISLATGRRLRVLCSYVDGGSGPDFHWRAALLASMRTG